MTANDIMALGVLRALKEKEISVPSEISVCGYDNLIFSETASIPITTINQDLKTIAERAVDIIMAIDEKGKMVIQDKIKPCLVIRSSSAAKNTRGV
ncbi:MAG: substrate-binding domain-containing protein, partial [Eubacteriales bacterium]|nr:substrate-binding domain-containing protein [Eubacteriales bacterium]